MRGLILVGVVVMAGCSWVNPSGRLGSDLPEVLKALAADKNTVHLNITAPTFGTLQFDKSAACPPIAPPTPLDQGISFGTGTPTLDPFGPGTPPVATPRPR